jgi:hypothetical protein
MITREQIELEYKMGEHAAACIRTFQACTLWANSRTGSISAGMSMTDLAKAAFVLPNHVSRYVKKDIAFGLLNRVEVRPGEFALFVNPAFAYHPKKVTSSGESGGDEVTSSGGSDSPVVVGEVTSSGGSPCTPYIESEDTEDSRERERAREEAPPVLKSGPKRKSPLPEDWDPGDAGLAYGRGLGIPDDVLKVEFGKFRNHQLAKGNEFADWNHAWRKWCDYAVEFARNTRSSSGLQTLQDSHMGRGALSKAALGTGGLNRAAARILANDGKVGSAGMIDVLAQSMADNPNFDPDRPPEANGAFGGDRIYHDRACELYYVAHGLDRQPMTIDITPTRKEI